METIAFVAECARMQLKLGTVFKCAKHEKSNNDSWKNISLAYLVF